MKRLLTAFLLFFGLIVITSAHDTDSAHSHSSNNSSMVQNSTWENDSNYKYHFSTKLSGSEEVPVINTTNSGKASFKVKLNENEIDYKLTTIVTENITAAHLHCGAKGQNGPVIVGLYDNPAGSAVTGELVSGTLDKDDILQMKNCDPGISTLSHLVQAMREEKIYVNVHTTENPNGLIRGQLTKYEKNSEQNEDNGNTGSEKFKHVFGAKPEGKQEVPMVETDASGKGSFKVFEDERKIKFDVKAKNIEGITAAHLHCGAKGENGPVVVDLFSNTEGIDANSKFADGTIDIDDISAAGASCSPNIFTMTHLVQAMREGRIYLNIHTVQYPNGEIRGQLNIGENNQDENDEEEEENDEDEDGEMEEGNPGNIFLTSNPDGPSDFLVRLNQELAVAQTYGGLQDLKGIQSAVFDDSDQAFITVDQNDGKGAVLVVKGIIDNTNDSLGTVFRKISGEMTGLIAPKGIEVVKDLNLIIVSDNGAKNIKAFGLDADGNQAPVYTIALGNSTRSVWDTHYDKNSDTLFAAGTDGAVLVYDDFSVNHGATGPTKTITPTNHLGEVLSINLHGIQYLDFADILILSDVGLATSATDGQLFVIENAMGANGNAEISILVKGLNTKLGNPVDVLYLDGDLYVAEKSNDLILVFEDFLEFGGLVNLPAEKQITLLKPESITQSI